MGQQKKVRLLPLYFLTTVDQYKSDGGGLSVDDIPGHPSQNPGCFFLTPASSSRLPYFIITVSRESCDLSIAQDPYNHSPVGAGSDKNGCFQI